MITFQFFYVIRGGFFPPINVYACCRWFDQYVKCFSTHTHWIQPIDSNEKKLHIYLWFITKMYFSGGDWKRWKSLIVLGIVNTKITSHDMTWHDIHDSWTSILHCFLSRSFICPFNCRIYFAHSKERRLDMLKMGIAYIWNPCNQLVSQSLSTTFTLWKSYLSVEKKKKKEKKTETN